MFSFAEIQGAVHPIHNDLVVVLLGAGYGQIKPGRAKAVYPPLNGRPMIDHILATLGECGFSKPIMVVGGMVDQVRDYLGDRCYYLEQPERLGPADAVMRAVRQLPSTVRHILYMYVDMPLFRPTTISNLIKTHIDENSSVTMVEVVLPDDYSGDLDCYGRILKNEFGQIQIIEPGDDVTVKSVRACNPSLWVFNCQDLLGIEADLLGQKDKKGEYRLPPAVMHLSRLGKKIVEIPLKDIDEALGANNLQQFLRLQEVYEKRHQGGY